MAHPYPLRYSLPIGFLLVGLAMIGLSYGFNYTDIRRRSEASMQERAIGLGRVIAPDLREELELRASAAPEKAVQRLRTVPQLRSAVICDDTGRILSATNPAWAGQSATAAAPWAAHLIGRTSDGTAPQLKFSPERDRLWAAFPISLTPGTTAFWLCTESDVAAVNAPAVAALNRRTGVLAAVAFTICTLVWLYFSRTVTRRARALVRITEAFAAGRLGPPLPIGGSDEFAKLNAAFNKMARDIRARDEAIRLSEERLAQAIDASELGTWDWNLETGDCVDNDTWWRMFGYEPGELPARGETWRQLSHPEDWTTVAAALDHHLAGQTVHFECEHRMRHKSGRWVWVVEKGRLTARNAAGKPVRVTGTTRDITARKEADAVLAAQRNLLEGIAQGEPLADSLAAICRFADDRVAGMVCSILILDRDGVHLRHGAAPGLPPDYCRAIDGIAAGPDVGSCGTAVFRRAQVIVTDIATDPLWKNFRELALAHGLRACWSTPILGPDGALLGTFAIYYRQPQSPTAEHRQIIAVATHTASIALQRSRAAATLQASEERFGRAFGSSPVPMFVSTLTEGRLIDANAAFVRVFGYAQKSDVIGRTSFELGLWHDPADRRQMLERLQAGGAITDVEVKFCRKNGEIGHSLASAELIEFDGELCSLSLFHDITARKQAEAAAAERQQILHAVLDHAPFGIWMQNATRRLIFVNGVFCQATGISEARFLAAPHYAELYDPATAQSCMASDRAALAQSGPHLSHEKLRFTDGRIHDLEITKCRLTDADGRVSGLIGLAIDVTERNRLQAERVSLEEQFRQSQKMEAIGQLAGGMAHDFNNILTAIIVRSDLASLQPGLTGEAREAFREVLRLSQRATALTGQLLAFSRRSVMNRRALNLSEVAAADAKMITRLVGEDIRLELVLAPGPLPIFADEAMLGQVLLNLAVNARDAMPRGGRLRIETCRSELTGHEPGLPPDVPPGPYACLGLADTGTGIAPEILPHIFEPFFTTKEVGKGTGLGLATVFGIVRQHQGWITVACPPTGGAVFRIYLPFAEAAAPSPTAAPVEVLPRGHETVLLVEDEAAVRLSAERLLTRQGYRVLSADHGPAARELWRRHRAEIHVLLTDVVMPGGINGHELAAEFQAEVPALPVVLATGYSAEIAGRNLALSPRQYLLQKPFTASQLLATLRQALSSV